MHSTSLHHKIVRNAVTYAEQNYNADVRAKNTMPSVLRLKIERTIWRELCLSGSNNNLEMEETARQIANAAVTKWLEKKYPTRPIRSTTTIAICPLM
jgi:hypothetical protein